MSEVRKRFNEAGGHPNLMEGVYLKSITVFALEHFPLIDPGDNLAKIIVETALNNRFEFENGDLVVVAQKVFSKAEKRVVSVNDVLPSEEAKELAKVVDKNPRFVELVLRETAKVLKASSEILLVEDKRGLICINAGIDKSNVEGVDNFALLPEKPDESAERCRRDLMKFTGRNVAVIVCDTYSRPFRRGQVNFAIGVAGINPFKDYRGQKDLFKQVLKVKNVAVIDEIAAAAELLMGQANEAMPVVIIRGLGELMKTCERYSMNDLSISSSEDLFKGVL